MSFILNSSELEHWSTQDVCDWLAQSGLDEATSWFQDNFVDGVKLMELSEARIVSIPNLKSTFKRRLFKEIEKIQKGITRDNKKKGALASGGKLNKNKPVPAIPERDYRSDGHQNHTQVADDAFEEEDSDEWDDGESNPSQHGSSDYEEADDKSDDSYEPMPNDGLHKPFRPPPGIPRQQPPTANADAPPPRPPKGQLQPSSTTNDITARPAPPRPEKKELPSRPEKKESLTSSMPAMPTRRPLARPDPAPVPQPRPEPEAEDPDEDYIIPEACFSRGQEAEDDENYLEPTFSNPESKPPLSPGSMFGPAPPPPVPGKVLGSETKPKFSLDIKSNNILPNKPTLPIKKPTNIVTDTRHSHFLPSHNKHDVTDSKPAKPDIGPKPMGGLVAQLQQKFQQQNAPGFKENTTLPMKSQTPSPQSKNKQENERKVPISPPSTMGALKSKFDKPPPPIPTMSRTLNNRNRTTSSTASDRSSDGSASGSYIEKPPPPPIATIPSRQSSFAKLDRPLPSTPSSQGLSPKPGDRTTRGALPPIPSENNNQEKNIIDLDPDSLYSYQWYHGDITREQLDPKLRSQAQNGSFLVRKSNKGGPNCPYTLSLLFKKKVWHLKIRRRHQDHLFALGTEKPNEQTFKNAVELVNYHQTTPLILAGDNGGETLLTKYPPKQI